MKRFVDVRLHDEREDDDEGGDQDYGKRDKGIWEVKWRKRVIRMVLVECLVWGMMRVIEKRERMVGEMRRL